MLDFTLIIPTKNRDQYLNNLLFYYSINSIKFKILILDSSTGKFKKKNKNIIKNFKNLKITHKFIKGKSHEVVKKNIKIVDSKYCCLSGDDDYLFTKNIQKFISFLENNKSFVGAGGISYFTKPYKDTFSFKSYSSTNLTNNDAFTRCKNHIFYYTNPHYSICKTSAFSKAINLINKSKYPHDILNDELVLNFSLVCFGKFKNLNKTHLFRLIGHEKNNLSKNKNINLLNYSKNNIIFELKKLIQKQDNTVYKNFEKEFTPLVDKKVSIIGLNFNYIKLYFLRYNFKESRIFYYLKKILFFLNDRKISKNLYYLNYNQIIKNRNISNDIKIFTRNFILSKNKY